MFDLILLDMGLPDVAQEDTVLAVQGMAPKTPIVVLSGQSDESVALRAVREGAQDYLVKGRIDAELLSRSIRYAVERKRSAEALRESEDRFQSFMNNSPAVAYMKDEQGRYVWVNALFERVLGLTPQTWHGKTDFDLWPHDVATRLRENDSMALSGGRAVEVSESVPGVSGQQEWLTLKFPFENAAGRRFLAAMSVDVTQRVRAEEALREAETARMRAVHLQSETLNALPAQVALIDENGEILVVNGSWVRFGKDRNRRTTGVGRNYLEISDSSECTDGMAVANGIRAVLAGRIPSFEHEYPCDHKDQKLWFRVHVSPIESLGKRGAVVMHLDITDRKAAEESLRRSEDRYRIIVETAQEGIWLVDERWRTTLVNTRMAEMLGYTVEEMMGRHLLDFIPDSERQSTIENMRRRESGVSEYHEFKFQRKNGGEIWTSISTCPIHDQSSGFTGALAMITDITERRRAEQALKEADEQLRQSQKMEAVGLLASGVAHDFNNLLTAIRGYASLARSTLYEDHPALESLDQVEEASRQATGVAGALLTFARKTRSEKVPVRLSSIVETAARLFRRTLPAGISFEADISRAADLWVEADETQLHQVIMNLALNARDAIERVGKITIIAEPAKLGDKPGAALIVRDTGMGMSAQVQTRIFEPFFTTKPRGRGTGLGLSVLHSIVAEHGGKISVDSRLGKGSTFTVTLAAIPAPTGHSDYMPPMLKGSLDAGLAVVVQNSPLVRGVVASMLSTLGYECAHAGSAGEARAVAGASSRPVSLIVADATLPDGPASDLVESLRTLAPNLKTILVADVLPPEESMTDPHVVWLKKPFRVNDLQQSLQRLAEKVEPAPQSERST